MTWIKFAIWLFGFYTAYYTSLVLWDAFQTKRTTVKEGSGELTFVDDVEQVKEVPDEESEIEVGSPVVSSGGVTLKQTFNLAREDAIAYIRAVSF